MRPQPFAAFALAYGFELTPAQDVLTAVSFDAASPTSLTGVARELASVIFGAVDEVPALARDVIVWVKGARIGGSRMAAMRLYQLGLTVPLDLAPGESAYGLVVGPDVRLARQAFRYALGAAKADEKAGRIVVVRESDASVTIERHDGQLVTLECLPASAGGSAVRGRTLVGAIMTEGAFFRDAEYAVNDQEVFRALAARIVPGGQLIIESTPWAADGLLHELFSANHGAPTTALAAHCPTVILRPDARTKAIVDREEQRDPDNAAREFGAQFMVGGSNLFFDATLIDASMTSTGGDDAQA
jgi:hypothetical protein